MALAEAETRRRPIGRSRVAAGATLVIGGAVLSADLGLPDIGLTTLTDASLYPKADWAPRVLRAKTTLLALAAVFATALLTACGGSTSSTPPVWSPR